MKNIPVDIGNYIAGFTDGEGSFNVSIKKRLDYKESWKLTASFNISQKDRVIHARITLSFWEILNDAVNFQLSL